MQAEFKKDNIKHIFTNFIIRYFNNPIVSQHYTKLLYDEAKKRSSTNEMIHRVLFGKNDSRVSYIYIANSKTVLVLEKEYILKIFHKLSKNNIKNILSKRCIVEDKLKKKKKAYMIIDYYKFHRRFYKIIKSNYYPIICITFSNKTYINGNKKEKLKIVIVSNTIINYMTIGNQFTGSNFSVSEICKVVEYYILNGGKHDHFLRNNKYFVINSIIKKTLVIKSFLKNNIRKSILNNMKYHCSEKNNCNINNTRFVKIGTRDCIEKKILRQTRQQASHMKKTSSIKKRSIQYKTSKKKINTKPIDKLGFCAEKKSNINVKEEKIDNTDNCKKIVSQVESSHINTMSLFYEVVDTKNNRPITNNYEITENYLKQNIKQKPTLIVKFKKIRQSELSLLNGEAENFMFPKRFSCDKQSPIKCERSPLKRSFSNAFETTNECKYINVRQHNEYNLPVHNNVSNTNNSTSDTDSNMKVSDMSFSFEKIPSNETWFNVFRRQDESKEKTFEYYGSTGFRKLPYEMGPLPPIQVCRSCTFQESEHKNSKKKVSTDEISTGKQSGSKNNEIDSKNFTQIHENSNNRNFEMPRISPREHASTLAILSCLIKKSNNEVDLLSTNGQVTENDNIYTNSHILKLIENVKSMRKKTSKSYNNEKKHSSSVHANKNCSNNKSRTLDKYVNTQKLTNELDYFLVTSFSENPEPSIDNQNINHFSNYMNLLEITENQYQQESQNKAALCPNKYKTKRKNNKTGWPKKKKIVTRQQKIKTDNKPKNSELIKRMSPITPPYSDSEESVQCSYLNALDDNFQHSYLNGIEEPVNACNNLEKKSDNFEDGYERNMKYELDKSNTSEKHIDYSLQPNIKFNYSPRKLRKLRGRYRER